MNTKNKIFENISKEFQSSFGERIVSLLTYGSVVNNRSNKMSDVDLFLLLNEYDVNDLKKCKQIAKKIDVKIDLSVQYYDQILNGALIHDGSKGVSALNYLSSAKTLIGSNPFTTMISNLNKELLSYDLKRLAYYYRDKLVSYFIQDTKDIDLYRKYLSRIVVCILLLESGKNMNELKKYNVKEILTLADNMFTKSNNNSFDSNDIDVILRNSERLMSYIVSVHNNS